MLKVTYVRTRPNIEIEFSPNSLYTENKDLFELHAVFLQRLKNAGKILERTEVTSNDLLQHTITTVYANQEAYDAKKNDPLNVEWESIWATYHGQHNIIIENTVEEIA